MKRIFTLTFLLIVVMLYGCEEKEEYKLHCVEISVSDSGKMFDIPTITVLIDDIPIQLKASHNQTSALAKGLIVNVNYDDTYKITKIDIVQGCKKELDKTNE